MQGQSENKDHFDLLPFIAILMCILGCLLLVTMSMAAISLGPGVGEAWIPTKSDREVAKTPVLIEWDGADVVIHRETKRDKLRWVMPKLRTFEINGQEVQIVEKDDKDRNPELTRFLEEMRRQTNTHYALFAVRPSGFTNFNFLSAPFRESNINIGYEPIPQSKSVRLMQRRSNP